MLLVLEAKEVVEVVSGFSASQCQQQGFPGKVHRLGRTEVLVTCQVTAGHAP